MGLHGGSSRNSNGLGLFVGPDMATGVKALEQMVAEQATKDLMVAAANGRSLEAVRTIELGADIDSTLNSYTPLMRAANWGHLNTIATLIAEGANMFATDRQGRTALDWARIARQDKSARLLERAMENEIRYRRESTRLGRDRKELLAALDANNQHARAVAAAIERRDLGGVKRIIDRANLSRRHFSSLCKSLSLTSTATVNGMETSVVAGDDKRETSTPKLPSEPTTGTVNRIMKTTAFGSIPVFFLDAEGPGGTTALTLATVQNDPEMARLLLKEGADPEIESKCGHTALTWAAVCGFDLVAAELLCHHRLGRGLGGEGGGAGESERAISNITRVTRKESRTALHNAAFNGNAGVIMLLLDRLRDMLLVDSFSKRRKSEEAVGPASGWFHPFRDFVRWRDCKGCTAAELANQAGHEEVVSILENAEGRIEEWEAGECAQELAAERIECQNEGCRHRDRRDRMDRHATYECTRRPAGCPACGQKLAAGDLDLHEEKQCDKRKAACPNAMKGCYDVMPHDRLAAHVAHICKYRRVECRRRCGASLAASSREEHEQEHCRLSKHPCVFGCGEQITKAGMDAHTKKDCVKRKLRCRLGCGTCVEAQHLTHHEQEVCTRACCWEGCGERLGPTRRRETHERYLCQHRPAECAHGCEVRGLSAGLKTVHELHHCRLRPVPCPHGCGAFLRSNELSAHIQAEGGSCPERLQRCRLDCLRRRILVATKLTPEHEDDHQCEEAEADGHTVVPGMLRHYDTSTGLFGIRYPDGNRKEALENLDFLWADEGSTRNGGNFTGSGGGGSVTGAWECGWVAAADMGDHLRNDCPRRMAPCRDGCGQSLVVREEERHYQGGCPKRYLACTLGCGVQVRQENLFSHTDEACPLRPTPCEECGLQVPFQDMGGHIAESCCRVPRRCTNGCGSLVRGDELSTHLASECPKRVVPCPLGCPEPELWAEEVKSHCEQQCPLYRQPCTRGCGEDVAVCSRETHEASECSERIVHCECGMDHAFSKTEGHRIMDCRAVVSYCTLGCGVKVRKMDMDHHQEKICERKTLRSLSKMIECPLGCGHLIQRQWEFQHSVFDCLKRPMRCPGGCSKDVPADEVDAHYQTCGRRKIRCGADSSGCERMLLTWVGLTEVTRKEKEASLPPVVYTGQGPRQGPSGGMLPCSDHGSDALIWAAGKGDAEHALLEELLNLTGGVRVNRESHLGDTALTNACARGHVETIRTIVKLGHANVNHETRSGKTALIEAARHDRVDVVRLLMELRAVIPYANRRGQTAAWWAARLGHERCLVPIARAVKAEATLRLMSSQIARGDVNAVRSLVELGEPYRDNHCAHLEAEIDRVSRDLDEAQKKLRDLSSAREDATPELEHLKASLEANLVKKRKIRDEAKQGARTGSGDGKSGNGKTAETALSTFMVNITSRSFEAMQARALRSLRRSAARLQALTDEDFQRVAHLPELSELAEDSRSDIDAEKENENASGGNGLGESDPTPSLSMHKDNKTKTRRGDGAEKGGHEQNVSGNCNSIGRNSGVRDGVEGEHPTNDGTAEQRDSGIDIDVAKRVDDAESTATREEGSSGPTVASTTTASILRVLRATVVILGGCGLGPLPSDRDLWRKAKEMLLDGSLRHRVRHLDRRAVPLGVMDGVRTLLNIGNNGNVHGQKSITSRQETHPTAADEEHHCDVVDSDDNDGHGATETFSPNQSTTKGKIAQAGNSLGASAVAASAGGEVKVVASGELPIGIGSTDEESDQEQKNAESTGGDSKAQIETESDTQSDDEHDDGPDPWGEGIGEATWGKDIKVARENEQGDVELTPLALMHALGSWCASMSAYDRLAWPTPGSAAGKAAAAETEWEELERRIARGKLDVQLEEFRYQLLSHETADATNAAEYLFQKRAWGEERLAVARTLSLVSPAGHSLVSWAAACGQVDVVEVLMDHGATAGPGDETRAVSASILQAFYRYRRWVRRQSSFDADGANPGVVTTTAAREDDRKANLKRRMEYAIELLGRHATLARLRRTRRLPFTEAAYNGHHELLQFFRMRRIPIYSASRTWLYPSAPPPFAPIGDGTLINYALDTPMSVADCADAGLRDRGCKQRIPGKGWVGEWHRDSRFATTVRIAGAIWSEITTVAAMGTEEKGRRRVLRLKMRRQEELIERIDCAIEEGYTKAPDIVALCQEGVSIDRETASGKTALISAAEEDPSAPGHSWVTNEEGWEVLAAALLLDRRIHRPKIDYESRVTGHTALTRACVLGRLESAEVLLNRGANVNRISQWRVSRTPPSPSPPRPFGPRSPPRSPLARLILPSTPEQRAAAAAARRPPLVVAAAAGHAEMVRLLLERGADAQIQDGEGRTAADVAREEGFVDVLAELAKQEAGNRGIATGGRGAANPLVPCGWGCGKLVAMGHDKVTHEEGCAHREVECIHACGAYRLQHRQLERHVAETCRRRPVVCSSRCGVSVPAEEYPHHQANSCAMRPVVCSACFNKVVASALGKHAEETCPQRLVECEQGCGASVPLSGMSRHVAKACPFTPVVCRLGCGITMWLKMRDDHEGSVCSERIMTCKWGCGQGIQAKHLPDHEQRECPRVKVPCGNRCGQSIPLGDMKLHYAETCGHRFVRCGIGCGYKIRAKDVLYHEANECQSRVIMCPHGCGDGPFPARASEVHLKYDCVFRMIKCAVCGDESAAGEIDLHKSTKCRRRSIACSNDGCWMCLPAEDMEAHEAVECPRRIVWCLQGCGETMLADTRRRHHTRACSMRYLPCPLGCPKKVRASETDDHVDLYCFRRHLG